MKILHFSELGLPDWRIEKSAITGSKFGHSVYFAGLFSPNYRSDVFKKIFRLNWTWQSKLQLPYYYDLLKKQTKNILDELSPDIIHAHNIFAAKISSEFDYPIVYDGHEYWSAYVKNQREIIPKIDAIATNTNILSFPRNIIRNGFKKILRSRSEYLWMKWERDLVSKYPSITVSNNIANELKKYGKKVVVIPNFPSKEEIIKFPEPFYHQRLSSVYAGIESPSFILPHRNLNGLIDLFNNNDLGYLVMIGIEGKSTNKINFKGYLQRSIMYDEMMNNSIGLIPLKRHWSHIYISPNKAFEYAHSGLFVLATSLFTSIKEHLGNNCIMYEDNAELSNNLNYFKTNLEELYQRRIAIFNYARENLLWENYENKILDIYKVC
ncbi:MAG: glycosyltransferase [Nitrososphaeraceae archaeon]|nr:glycosyltransferase [Nitrososphaeraceae archaeon]